MTNEHRIRQYYQTGLSCFHAGRRADAALMLAAIRCYDPMHPLAARLRAALTGGRHDIAEADDMTLWEENDEADIDRSFVRWRNSPAPSDI